ncbi:YciI family protein [Luteimonas gilva]|uniref:YciI family protein n=1 Tax=Luteimonas gilva TaxID=2572684 RepID=A0A4U5JW47_9GAMM|nr:YciI family protein [Luteimonas gilva]TKR33316.1 YciI family protein [Luteimonas gilva]
MRVMVFVKAAEIGDMKDPTPEDLEAFAAMDRFTEELVKAGVFVAAAGLKTGADAKRITYDGTELAIVDGPFAESKELVAGFSIWQVRDMNEALAWVKRAPLTADSIMEIFPFYEAEDLGGFVTPEELATPRSGERGKLGVA